MTVAFPAAAQLSGSVAVQSDYVVRGYSVTAGKPAALLNLSYDDPSGVYVNGSAIEALSYDNSAILEGLISNIGYARRLTPQLSIDTGVVRTQYYRLYGFKGDYAYDEAYVGLAGHGLSAHLYVSPDYLRHGTDTLYSEVEGVRPVWAGVRLGAHLGYFAYLNSPGGAPRQNQYDWRLFAARRFAPFDLSLAVSGGGPGQDHYLGGAHDKTRVIGTLSWAF